MCWRTPDIYLITINEITIVIPPCSKSIESVDYDTNRLPATQIPFFSNHRMYGLTAITDNCPLFYSPCQVANGGCAADRMCLANHSSPGGRTCKCLETAVDCTDEDFSQWPAVPEN